MTIDDACRLLGIARNATPAAAQRAFRRLAHRCHPDVAREAGAAGRFAELVRAFRIVQQQQRAAASGAAFGRCPECGESAELLRLLDGREACPRCLLARPAGVYFLPLPVTVMVRHLAVCACYLAAAGLLAGAVWRGEARLLGWSLLAALTGGLLLVMSVRRHAWRRRATCLRAGGGVPRER